jgi:hypothetical protein
MRLPFAPAINPVPVTRLFSHGQLVRLRFFDFILVQFVPKGTDNYASWFGGPCPIIVA